MGKRSVRALVGDLLLILGGRSEKMVERDLRSSSLGSGPWMAAIVHLPRPTSRRHAGVEFLQPADASLCFDAVRLLVRIVPARVVPLGHRLDYDSVPASEHPHLQSNPG